MIRNIIHQKLLKAIQKKVKIHKGKSNKVENLINQILSLKRVGHLHYLDILREVIISIGIGGKNQYKSHTLLQ